MKSWLKWGENGPPSKLQEENGDITISQTDYKDSVEEIKVPEDNTPGRSLNKEEYKSFRAAAGKLTWLSEMTRPDLQYDCLELSCRSRNAKVEDISKMNKLIKRAKEQDNCIRYTRIGKLDTLKVLAVTDAAYLKLEDKTKSVMGRFIFLTDNDEKVGAPIVWKSKSIPTVCKSAKDAETRAADKCSEEAIYVARSIKELLSGQRGENQIKVDIVTDSMPLIDSLNSTKQVENKLLRPLIKYMKQCLDAKMINSIRWCDTKVCLADVLTKASSPLIKIIMDILSTGKLIDLNWTNKNVSGVTVS